jgi:putative membrane protein
MKYLFRVYLFNCFALWFVSQILPALTISGGWQVLLFAGFILSILMLLVHPLLKILFIPINIITFGLLSWITNVIVLYLLTVFASDISIRAWRFPGASWAGFVMPPMNLSYIVSLILVSLSVTFFANLLHDISEH